MHGAYAILHVKTQVLPRDKQTPSHVPSTLQNKSFKAKSRSLNYSPTRGATNRYVNQDPYISC